jgi:hypothetical protein
MRTRALALAAAAAVIGFTIPSHAATPKPQITDPTGDGNAVNDQGLGEPVPNASRTTPAGYSGGDIVSVLFQTVFVKRGTKRVANGFTVTLKLAAAPGPQTDYRITAQTPSCSADVGQVRFQYDTVAAGADGGAQCFSTTATKLSPIKTTSVTVKGTSIIWRLPASAVPKGTSFSDLAVSTRMVFPGSPSPRSATVPAVDTATSSKIYTYGS